MKCLIFVSNLILFISLMGCTQKDPVKTIHLVYCKMDGKELSKYDTLIVKNENNDMYDLELITGDTTIDFKAEQKLDYVKLFYGDSSGIIYKMDSTKYINSFIHYDFTSPVKSPYLMGDSKFLGNKKYLINNKTYNVLWFRTNELRGTRNDYYYAYYNYEFGFLLYVIDRGKYIKIKKMVNYSSEINEACSKLITAILRDSSFFAYYPDDLDKPVE